MSQRAESGLLLPQNASQKARETPLEHEQRRENPLIFHLHTQAPPPRIWLHYSSFFSAGPLFVLLKVVFYSKLPNNIKKENNH